jgi:squalene synthase HpnC
MFVGSSRAIEAAFRKCKAIAARHYENFPIASLFLSREKRKHVAAIYAFARTADDYADEPGFSPDERLKKLSQLGEKLKKCESSEISDPLFLALGDTIRRFRLSTKPFENLLAAFEMDTANKRYETWDELLEYCSYSANPIGRLMLQLHGYDDEGRRRASDAICTALQLTNFWQDLSTDARRGRIYVPQEDLRMFGCSEIDILEERNVERVRNLLSYEIDRTAALFEEGKPLLDSVAGGFRLHLRVTYLGGMLILTKMKRRGIDPFNYRPTATTWDKFKIGSTVIGFSLWKSN